MVSGNKDLEKIVDTTDEWITQRTGIKERRISDKDTATSDLATIAAKRAPRNVGQGEDQLGRQREGPHEPRLRGAVAAVDDEVVGQIGGGLGP